MRKPPKHLDLQRDDPLSTWWKRGHNVVEKGSPGGGKGVPRWWKMGPSAVEKGALGGGKGGAGQKYGIWE